MDDFTEPLRRTNGGARPNSGPKPIGYVKSDDLKALDAAKARKEAALADQHELDYKIKSGEYVSRASVKQASATAMATLAQTLRSLPDNLERKGVSPEICAVIDEAVIDTLAEAGKALRAIYERPDDDCGDLF